MKQVSTWGILFVLPLLSLQTNAASRPFSVRDSIQMERFNTQSFDGQTGPTIVNDSPTHAFGLVLTSRGLIESNEIQSTLWLLDYRKLQSSLDKHRATFDPRPLSLASITAIPSIDARGAGVYGSVIFNIRWSADSRKVYFLGETSHGSRQLYVVSVASRIVKSLTPNNLDVESFDVVADTIVYRASSALDEIDQPSPGVAVGPGISVVTGLPIADILGNDRAQRLRQYNLWCLYNEKHQLVFKVPPSVQASSFLLARPLALSPNARFSVMLSMAKGIPPSWERFETPKEFTTLRLDHRDIRPISPHNSADPLREYLLVDLQRHAEIELGAVDATYFNFPGAVTARWSENSKRVLITNVFLSPEGTDTDPAKLVHPCEAAVFEIESRRSHCLAFGGSNSSEPADVHLQDAAFDSTGNGITLSYGTYGQGTRYTATYHYIDHEWEADAAALRKTNDAREGQQSAIDLSIREGLNERPILWAKNRLTGTEMKVWDPNPNFEQLLLGEASVYHWADRVGRPWIGGLFLPIDYVKGRRYPLVIQTHGFPPLKFVVDGAYPTAMAARALASAGIMVLQVGQGGDRDHIGSNAEAIDNAEAYDAAIDALDAAGLIDPSKVGIVGFSRTCWYVENAIIRSPHRFAAAIIADGVSYSYMQYHLFGPGNTFNQKDDEKVIGGVPIGKGFQRWLELSPDFHSDQIMAPLRIEAIRPISVLNEWELYSSLAMRGKPVDLIYYPDGQHILQKPLERLASEQGSVDWFRFWLQGYKDPTSLNQAQYRRWQLMKGPVEHQVQN